MKKLAELSPETSVAHQFLEDFDYDPKKLQACFEEHHLYEDIKYLYEMPFEELPMQINNATYMGYISFRLNVGK